MTNEIKKTLNNEIKKAAANEGYSFVRFTFCPDCAKYIKELEKEQGVFFHWANPNCALMFSKKKHPVIIACACGYRGKLELKEYKEAPECRTEGCNVKVGKKNIEENDGYCYKCKPYQNTSQPAETAEKKPIKVTNKCVTKGCGNNLPEGRKSYCYTCRPKNMGHAPKQEEAQQEVVM